MPPTCPGCSRRHGLRQRCGICEHLSPTICPRHWPSTCLWGWAEFNFAGKPAVVGNCGGDENISCEHHLRSHRSSLRRLLRRFDPYLEVKWVENCAIRFAFRANLSMSATHRRCAGDPLGQVAERCQLQPATTPQVGRRDMRTRLHWLTDSSTRP